LKHGKDLSRCPKIGFRMSKDYGSNLGNLGRSLKVVYILGVATSRE
jgi:hypothetical protein